jgi:hypothetical protein
MVRYLLDANIASYAIKGNVARVRERRLSTPMAEINATLRSRLLSNAPEIPWETWRC